MRFSGQAMTLKSFNQALDAVFATHREKFALKRKMDLQKKRALAQYGPDGPGKGPPDPEPPTGQRMAVNE